ncbi:MAG: DUF3696 domain-containing protein [Bacteroidales bacterium]|nr:DUF3696 domain-containing protein [Bacteroidales bacterium]
MENNKNMNPIFSLKNFRSFGEDGADFELAPITVLTGCNSAGKSSLVKALMLLSQATETMTSEFDEPFSRIIENVRGVDLLVSSKDLCLGNYTKILNKNSNEGLVELSYTIWSSILKEKVHIIRIYKEDSKDTLQNGQLVGIYIKKNDGTLIYGKGPGVKNLNNPSLNEDECFNRDCLQDVINQIDVLSDYYFKRKEYDDAKMRLEVLQKNQERLKEEIDNFEEVQHNIKKEYDKAKIDFEQAKNRVENSNVSREDFAKIEEGYRTEKEEYCTIESMDIYRKWGSEEIKRDFGGEFGLENWGYNVNDKNFLNILSEEIFNPLFIKDIKYVSSSSAMISRLYSVDEKDKLNVALKLFLHRKKSMKNGRPDFPDVEWVFPGQFISRWIKKFDIGDKIDIVGTDEGLGVMVYLYKNGQKSLLADEGYGVTQLFSLLLHIDNMMLEYKSKRTCFICVEEPEIHLHPKYQSLLADMFVETYQKYGIHFIIETHSEYLIRKLQVLVADKENALSPNDVSLNYVEKDKNGVSTNRQIKIEEDGSLSGSFGAGFYDEADTLAIQLFRNKPILS